MSEPTPPTPPASPPPRRAWHYTGPGLIIGLVAGALLSLALTQRVGWMATAGAALGIVAGAALEAIIARRRP